MTIRIVKGATPPAKFDTAKEAFESDYTNAENLKEIYKHLQDLPTSTSEGVALKAVLLGIIKTHSLHLAPALEDAPEPSHDNSSDGSLVAD